MRKVSILVLLACVVVSCPLFAVSDEAKSAIEQLRSKYRAEADAAVQPCVPQPESTKPPVEKEALSEVASKTQALPDGDLFAAIEAGNLGLVKKHLNRKKEWWKDTSNGKTAENRAWELWMNASGPDSAGRQKVYAYIYDKTPANARAAQLKESGINVSRDSGSSWASSSSSGGNVHVRGYYRKDGTYVRSHSRRR